MIQKGHNSEAKLVLSLAVQICFKIGEAFFLILFHEFIGVAAAVTDCPVMNLRYKSIKVEKPAAGNETCAWRADAEAARAGKRNCKGRFPSIS